MGDFDKIIAAAIENGSTIEEIAKEVTDALNKAQKHEVSPKDAYIEELQEQFKKAIVEQVFTTEDAIAAVILCTIEKYPNWTLDSIQMLAESVKDNIKATAAMIDAVENGDNPLKVMADLVEEAFATKFGIEPTETKEECKCGGHCRSDEEKLNIFLKNLGL